MKELKEELYKLIDELSDDGLIKAQHELQKILFYESVEYDDEELTAVEIAEIEQAREEYARGEYYTFEEVFDISQEQAYKEYILEKERVKQGSDEKTSNKDAIKECDLSDDKKE